MPNPFRALVPSAQVAVLLLAALGVIGLGTSSVRAHHEARRAREAVCAARVEAVMARSPLIAKGYFMSDDPCRNLAGLVGETGR